MKDMRKGTCHAPWAMNGKGTRGCKDKVPRIAKDKSGGLYLSMDGSSKKDAPHRILELREFLGNENNPLREKSLRALKAKHPNLDLWIHDLACKANFADCLSHSILTTVARFDAYVVVERWLSKR